MLCVMNFAIATKKIMMMTFMLISTVSGVGKHFV